MVVTIIERSLGFLERQDMARVSIVVTKNSSLGVKNGRNKMNDKRPKEYEFGDRKYRKKFYSLQNFYLFVRKKIEYRYSYKRNK